MAAHGGLGGGALGYTLAEAGGTPEGKVAQTQKRAANITALLTEIDTLLASDTTVLRPERHERVNRRLRQHVSCSRP